MVTLPQYFVQWVLQVHQEEGRLWLARVPEILRACEQRWGLTIEAVFPNLTFNLVMRARRQDGTPAVLKICWTSDEYQHQKEALRLFDGGGMIRLLGFYDEDEVMLLEGARPGTSLLGMSDDVMATSTAADVMRKIWRPVVGEHSFPTVERWGLGFERLRQRFDGGSGPFPEGIVDRAEQLYGELCDSMGERVLLHGDLHQDNVLAAERQPWLAIDPKGMVGEREYETGSWLCNWLPDLLRQENPRKILARRIDQFAEELGFDRVRIRDWAIAQAVLSGWWYIEDLSVEQSMKDDSWRPVLRCAELLVSLR
jgi:streptomycin 6-kinase